MEVGLISSVVFLPLAVGMLLLFTGKLLPDRLWQIVGLMATAATFVLSAQLWANY